MNILEAVGGGVAGVEEGATRDPAPARRVHPQTNY